MSEIDLSHVSWRNRAYPQLIVTGIICFCCPGMFNAMQGLGNAGGSNPDVASAMNAVLYGCFAVFGYFGGFFFNVFGNRLLLGGGGATYALYALGVYLWGKNDSWAWFAILASGLLGVGAGFLWTAQGAMMMSYATEDRKGLYTWTFWVIFNAGGMFGGLLSFALNFNDDSTSVNAASYFTFIGIMAVGSILSFILLVPPSKVVRDDGKPIVFEKSPGPMHEFKSVLNLFTNKSMLVMIPLIVQSNWFYTYEFGGFNGLLFNSRTRGFNSAMYWGAQMFGAVTIGMFLDNKKMTRQRRAVIGITGVALINSAQWVWAVIMHYTFDGTSYDKGNEPDPRIDITDGGRFFLPFFLFVLMGVCDSMVQTYAYWLMGALANGPDECARFAGFYKGVQSAGACIAWVMDSQGASYRAQLWTCVALSCAFIPPTYLVATWVTETSEEVSDEEEAVEYAEEKEAGVYVQDPNVVADATSPYMQPATNYAPEAYTQPQPQYYQ